VQLRHPRLVDAELGANVFHGHFVVVVERDHALFARRQRRNGIAHARLHLVALVLHVGALRFGGHHHGRQLRLVHVLGARERRGRLNGVDADDGLAEPFLVGADLVGEVGERGFVAERGAQLLARGLQLAPDPADTARPGVLAQGIDHGPADAAFRERLELDPARVVEAVGGIDQADHAVLHQVAQVDRVRHGRRHAAGQCFNERNTGFNAAGFTRRRVFVGDLGSHRGHLKNLRCLP